MKSWRTALILIVLAVLVIAFCAPVKAQSQSIPGVVLIKADGSINPPTSLIQQVGNTYMLTGDLNTQILLQKSNTVLDGNDHILGGGGILVGSSQIMTNLTIQNFFINSGLSGVSTSNCSDITIQNNTMHGGTYILGQTSGIYLYNCSSVKVIGNVLKGYMCGIDLVASSDNIIAGNIINAQSSWTWGHYPAAIMIDVLYGEASTYASGSINNLIYDNVFQSNGNLTAINGAPFNSWDNGKIGNYWSNYLSEYPNASEVDGSGIGNTPYAIAANNVDHYPLINQSNIILPPPLASVPTTTPNVTLTPAPSSSSASGSESNISPTSSSTVPEFQIEMILPLFAAVILVSIVFIRKRVAKKSSLFVTSSI